MVPLPFPLLLIFPALAIDLVLRKAGERNGKLQHLSLAVLLGGVFFVVLLVVQWFFSEFMIFFGNAVDALFKVLKRGAKPSFTSFGQGLAA